MEFYKMQARLMQIDIHVDVNVGTSLIECLQKVEERKAKHKEG